MLYCFKQRLLPRVVGSLADHCSSALQMIRIRFLPFPAVTTNNSVPCLSPSVACMLPSFPKRIMTRQSLPYQLPCEMALAHFRPTLPYLSSNLGNSIVIFFEPVGVAFFQDCPALPKEVHSSYCLFMAHPINQLQV